MKLFYTLYSRRRNSASKQLFLRHISHISFVFDLFQQFLLFELTFGRTRPFLVCFRHSRTLPVSAYVECVVESFVEITLHCASEDRSAVLLVQECFIEGLLIAPMKRRLVVGNYKQTSYTREINVFAFLGRMKSALSLLA